ncbi:MAG: ribbon-helix-helix protein, CopG family [Armatimonadota bacterium]|nr:ribbon-helix-helix protein, CopG family [Armatimonadota bacterium]MDR7421083.1 ribbon-helix-helix protein, CopG family [Armatimonadota bacterium]MDR7453216.1 ribbon-helix-helix protein, CopG family [Armatimonadota bacterium]MDR7455831.1 ribbon-helix-helix protein, CopG family [Armatimonadota bacterium]MDR7498095.1 ribbon-helix-helix protein, CopG family [Armatimonadota bacterium]
MERQLTVRVPAMLADQLDRAARRLRRTRSGVVRLALEAFLDGRRPPDAARPVELVHDLLGSIDSGLPDLGQRHREYLLSRLRRGRQPAP